MVPDPFWSSGFALSCGGGPSAVTTPLPVLAGVDYGRRVHGNDSLKTWAAWPWATRMGTEG